MEYARHHAYLAQIQRYFRVCTHLLDRVARKVKFFDFTYMLEYLLELTSGLSGISTRFFSM